MANTFTSENTFIKVDESLGIILGFGIICKQDGEDYYDLQNHHIPEDSMFQATVDFMKNSNQIRDMHIKTDDGLLPGSLVFSFPLTEEIAKSFGIETKTTGWMVGFMPEDDSVLEMFKSGERTGFSIGGSIFESEEVNA